MHVIILKEDRNGYFIKQLNSALNWIFESLFYLSSTKVLVIFYQYSDSIDTITDIFDYFASLIMYRIVCLKEPPLLLPFFKRYTTARPVRGPHKDLDPTTATKDWGLHSFQVKYSNFWNNIPPCIRDLPSFSQFKKAIRQYLYKTDNDNYLLY